MPAGCRRTLAEPREFGCLGRSTYVASEVVQWTHQHLSVEVLRRKFELFRAMAARRTCRAESSADRSSLCRFQRDRASWWTATRARFGCASARIGCAASFLILGRFAGRSQRWHSVRCLNTRAGSDREKARWECSWFGCGASAAASTLACQRKCFLQQSIRPSDGSESPPCCCSSWRFRSAVARPSSPDLRSRSASTARIVGWRNAGASNFRWRTPYPSWGIGRKRFQGTPRPSGLGRSPLSSHPHRSSPPGGSHSGWWNQTRCLCGSEWVCTCKPGRWWEMCSLRFAALSRRARKSKAAEFVWRKLFVRKALEKSFQVQKFA